MCLNQERPPQGGFHAAFAATLLLFFLGVAPTVHGQSISPSSPTQGIEPEGIDLLQTPSFPSPLVSQIETTQNLPPQLTRANLVPSIVDITAGNRNVMAIAEVPLTPEVQGVTFYLRPRDIDNAPSLRLAGTLIATSAANGRWEALISIPMGCLPGRWALAVVVQPTQGQSVEFGPFSQTPLPTNSGKELMVVNNGNIDSTIPEVEILKVDPQLAFVGCGNVATPVKIRLRVKTVNGLDDSETSCVQLLRSDLSSSINGGALTEANRISGTATDGIYEATVDVPPHLEPGAFIASASARSRAGWAGKMIRSGLRVEVRSLKNLPRGYVEWATKNFPGSFPDPECQSHLLWRPDGDVDGDGVMNCVEAYFGTSPTNKAETPKILVSYDSKRQFVVNWTQPQNTYGMIVQPEWSPDLDLWFGSDESFAGMKARTINMSDEGPAPKGGVFKEARFDVNGLTHAYLRLRVLMP